MTAGQFALQLVLGLIPALIVAIITIWLSRRVSRADRWREEVDKKVQAHDIAIVRLDTSVTYVNAHIEKMGEDVSQTRREAEQTRQLVERLFGYIANNLPQWDGVRKD